MDNLFESYMAAKCLIKAQERIIDDFKSGKRYLKLQEDYRRVCTGYRRELSLRWATLMPGWSATGTCGLTITMPYEIESAIKEIYGLPGSEGSTDEIERLCLFIPYFINALQVDEDNALSKEELNNLKVILKCSVVTSVNATTEDPDSDSRNWDYRSKNKELVKETAEKLKNIGNFTAWMPRKARPGVKFSDISGWYTYPKQQIKILVAEVEESAKI